MDRKAIAAILEEMALLMELAGENPFKVQAYAAGARAVLTFPGDLEEAALRGELSRVKGLGKSLAGVITELVQHGEAALHRELKGKIPPGLLELLQVPGLGPKKARVLFEELHLTGLGELEYAIRENRLAALPGFGVKTQERLKAGLESVKRYAGLFRLGELLPLGRALLSALQRLPAVSAVDLAGEVRRALEVADGLDFVLATDNAGETAAALAALPGVNDFAAAGPGRFQATLPRGIALRLILTAPPAFGAALADATGNAGHCRALQALARDQGLHLTAGGLFAGPDLIPTPTEESLYQRLGLPCIPPELREDLGEIAAARDHRLPRLVTLEDVRGCCHVHSFFSDGANSLPELISAAQARGWQFLGVSDHSQSAFYAGGLKPGDLERQRLDIEVQRRAHPDFSLFWGIESDILTDGSLDYPPDLLAGFDFVIASVHSQFRLGREAMTARLLAAMADPHCTMVGHLTGRLLLAREGYEVDHEAILAAAARHQVIMELNSSPYRLDLDWRWLRRARELGVLISLNPDAHSLEGLDDVSYGVLAARKGWLTPADVLNAYPPDAAARLLRRRRSP